MNLALLLVTPMLLTSLSLLASLRFRKRAGLLPALRASFSVAALAGWLLLVSWLVIRFFSHKFSGQGPVEWLGFQAPNSAAPSGSSSVLRAAFPWLNFLLASGAGALLFILAAFLSDGSKAGFGGVGDSRDSSASRDSKESRDSKNSSSGAWGNSRASRDSSNSRGSSASAKAGRVRGSPGSEHGRSSRISAHPGISSHPEDSAPPEDSSRSGDSTLSKNSGRIGLTGLSEFNDKLPYSLTLSLLFAATGLCIQAAFLAAPRKWEAASLPIDVAILLPQLAWLFALQLRSRPLPPAPEEKQDLPLPQAQRPDLVPALAKAGLIDPAKGALFHFEEGPEIDSPAPRSFDEVLWQSAGGSGRLPQGLQTLAENRGFGSSAYLVGDLPGKTGEAFRLTALASALLDGQRVLALGGDPQKERHLLRKLLTQLQKWPSGPLLAGSAELEESLKKGVLPAAVFLSFSELASRGVPLLVQPSAKAFRDGLGLILLLAPDALLPLPASHLHFALRRLHLPWAENGGAPALLATGNQSAASRRFIEDAIGRPVHSLAPGFESRAALRVFAAKSPPAAARGEARNRWWAKQTLAARQALAHLSEQQVEVKAEAQREASTEPISNTLGFAANTPPSRNTKPTELAPGDVEAPGYGGECSLMLLDEGQLAAMYRAGAHIAAPLHAAAHVSLWFSPDSLLSRFLLSPGRLGALHAKGELPSPRPLVGKHNRWLASAHLDAALREGEYSESALRNAFGETALNARLAQQVEVESPGFIASRAPHNGRIQRSSRWRATGKGRAMSEGGTITLDVIQIVDAQSGRFLGSVDRRLAPTRYYPQRVFEHQGQRYQVPANAWASPEGSALRRLLVQAAGENAPSNQPELEIRISSPKILGAPVTSTRNARTLALLQAEVTVHEQVQRAWVDNSQQDGLHFSPVQAEYPSRIALLYFPHPSHPSTLHHLARLIDAVLLGHLQAAPEDVEVIAVEAGFADFGNPGIAFVDRHLGGLGVAEALEPAVIHELIVWSRSLIYSCHCLEGCDHCSPHDLPTHLRDKQGVLRLLDGGRGNAAAS